MVHYPHPVSLVCQPAHAIQDGGWCRRVDLPDGAIHVWGFSLEGSDETFAACRSWLSVDEAGKVDGVMGLERQNQALLVRGCVRAVLARYTGLHPVALRFQVGAGGKPELVLQGEPNDPLRFNLSHSHGRLLIAVTRGAEVGADLEWVGRRANFLALAQRFYAAQESARVSELEGADQARLFYRYWVAKEAFLKCAGVGLCGSLAQCEVALPAEGRVGAPVVWKDTAGALRHGTVQFLAMGPDWIGAVAAMGEGWRVEAHHWDGADALH